MLFKKKLILPLLIMFALLPAIYAVLPLFGQRFIPTHDGEYHIIRFYEFFTMLQEGYWFPRWAPNLNGGYGIPLFNFHYPFPNYIGSFLHLLGLSFIDSFKFALALAYVISVLACFMWLRKLFSPNPALAGAILFSYIPYWFVDLYVRGSVGEAWAIAWFVLILASVEYDHPQLYSISLGLLILSHNILSFVLFPLVIAYLLLRKKNWVLATCLGVGLAAYFWVPAIIERDLVTGLNIVNFRDHFPELFQILIPSWGTGFSREGISYDEMSFQIGLAPLFAVIWGIWLSRKETIVSYRMLNTACTALFISALFLMLHVSEFIWEMLPFLQLIQYPWRLLSLLLPVSAYFGAYCIYKFQSNTLVIVVLVMGSLVSSLGYIRPVTYDPRSDNYYLSRKEFTDGTSSMANTFSTRWLPWKNERAVQKLEVTAGDAKISDQTIKPGTYTATVTSESESILMAHTAYYPGWKVMVNGREVPIEYNNGLINFTLPQGKSMVKVIFGETNVRLIADSLSLICLFWIILLGILNRYDSRNRYFAHK